MKSAIITPRWGRRALAAFWSGWGQGWRAGFVAGRTARDEAVLEEYERRLREESVHLAAAWRAS